MKNPIFEPSGWSRGWADYALNIYTGCTAGCWFCASPTRQHKELDEFSKNVRERDGLEYALSAQLAEWREAGLPPRRVMLCPDCDPYPPGVDTRATRHCIQLIKSAGYRVSILTRFPNMRDVDLFGEGDEYGITISDKPRTETEKAKIYGMYRRLIDISQSSGCRTYIAFAPVFVPGWVLQAICALSADRYIVAKPLRLPAKYDWQSFREKAQERAEERGKRLTVIE